MASSMLGSLFRRAPKAPASNVHFPYTIETNPYKCKRTWPPDFSKLSHKHQFRLERRYRRRTKLKWARPNWVKAVKLTQWGAILFVLGYGVLYMEMDERLWPIMNIRRWYEQQLSALTGARNYGPSVSDQGVDTETSNG